MSIDDVDPIDEQAATIDARSDDAVEQIAQLVEHAEDLGRDVSDSPIQPADGDGSPPPDTSVTIEPSQGI